MSTPVEIVRADTKIYKRSIEESLLNLENAVTTLPFKFDTIPDPFKRSCIRDITQTERALAHLSHELICKHLVKQSDDLKTVKMDMMDYPYRSPTLVQLRTALQEAERSLVEAPAPVPTDVFSEDTYSADGHGIQYYATFATNEEACKVIEMGEFSFKSGEEPFAVRFRRADPRAARMDWMEIRGLIERLDTVQKALVQLGAIETNDPYPFHVEVNERLIVDASPGYLEKLEALEKRFSEKDYTGLSFLDKTPVPNLEVIKQRVADLGQERIELIFSLRKFQGKGYVFKINIAI
jgi:hypothetical protein